MKRFTVSIDVISATRSLEELSRSLGESISDDSFDKSEHDGAGRLRKHTRLRIPSPVDDAQPLVAHIEALRPIALRVSQRLSQEGCEYAELMLDVAVFFDTAMATIELSSSQFDDLAIPITISISAYPVGEECTADPS